MSPVAIERYRRRRLLSRTRHRLTNLLSLRQDSQGSQEAPPPYDSCPRISEEEVDEIVATYDVPLPASWPHVSPHEKGWNLDFTFGSSPAANSSWHAFLYVWSANVAQLMRDGFHWSAANFDRTRVSIHINDTEYAAAARTRLGTWNCIRGYELRSLPGEPKWVGALEIIAESPYALLNVDESDINFDNFQRAQAYGPDFERVYIALSYKNRPGCYCNMLFGNRPMNGWWPAPKRDGDRLPVGWRDDES